MNTLPLVLPELHAPLKHCPTVNLSEETAETMRDLLKTLAEQALKQASTLPAIIEEQHFTPEAGSDRTVRLLTIRPEQPASTPRPALLHIHGGGHFSGLPEMNATDLAHFATELECIVISPDYRLTPETPFPGGIEDIYATLCWMHDNAQTLGIDPTRIGVTGESAGGGLAAALCLLTRDRNGPPLLFQNLIYPMLDDRTINTQPNPSPISGEFVWTRQSNTHAWTILLNPNTPAGPDTSPYAAPARATDLSNLPPTLMIVGALDLFLEEDLTYTQGLIRAGIHTELHVVPGAFHAFDTLGTPVAKETLHQRTTFMKSFFNQTS